MKRDFDVPESAPVTQRIAVIGGGISGLAAAHHLRELASACDVPVNVSLFEAGARLGGLIATRDLAGHRVELGADSFITNKPAAIRLCERLGLTDRLISTDPGFRGALVLRKGKLYPVPDGFQLMTPALMWPMLRSPLLSPWGKMRMGWEYFLPCRQEGDDESLAHFVRRRFGREALDRLVQPLVGGIYTSDPEKLSLRATLPRFLEMERKEGSLIRASRKQLRSTPGEKATGARYGLFMTLNEGLQELVETLVARISQTDTVSMNCRATKLEHLGRSDKIPQTTGVRITFEDGRQEDFAAAVVALPAYRTAELVEPFAADWSSALKTIEYASSVVVVSGHDLKDVQNPLNAFGLVIPAKEQRNILAVSFTSRKFPARSPEGRCQLRTFVGGAMQPELNDLSDSEILKIVREELRDLLGVTGTPDFEEVVRYPRAMPQYHVGHLDRIAAIEQEAAAFPAIKLAGNAYHGVGIPDSIQSGEQAAKAVAEQLGWPMIPR